MAKCFTTDDVVVSTLIFLWWLVGLTGLLLWATSNLRLPFHHVMLSESVSLSLHESLAGIPNIPEVNKAHGHSGLASCKSVQSIRMVHSRFRCCSVESGMAHFRFRCCHACPRMTIPHMYPVVRKLLFYSGFAMFLITLAMSRDTPGMSLFQETV